MIRIINITCIVAVVVALLPAAVYLITEWRTRRDRLFDVLADESLRLYYQRFFPSKRITKETKLEKYFQKEFGRLYGRRHYVIPLILLAVVTGMGMWMTAIKLTGWWEASNEAARFPMIVVSAFLGAYSWVLLDQFGRYQSRDFSKHNVYNGVYRLLISVPLGFSFAALANPAIGVPLAFLLGAFPTQTLMKFARRLVVEQMKLGEQEVDGPSELVQLQGIGRDNAERFQRIDVTTIVQLAWADPVELTIRTNLDFNYIIDCISQALLWVYFTNETSKLYRLSLRGAQEVKYFYDLLESQDPQEALAKARAQQTLIDAARTLTMSVKGLQNTLEQIAGDPYTLFICEVWPADDSDKSEDEE